MNNRMITIAIALLACVMAHAQTGAQKMHDLLTAFAKSGEHHVQVVKDQEGFRSVYFTEVWATDLIQASGSNPEKLFPPHLSAFFKAFSDYAGEAVETYFHDAPEGDPMMPGLEITIDGMGHNWSSGWKIPLKPSENVRLILLKEPDDQRRLFIMTWEQSLNHDTQTHTDLIATHGTIEEYYGYKPRNAAFVAPYQKKVDNPIPEVSTPQTVSFDELRAKVKRTSDIFRNERNSGQDAAAVVLHRLSESYQGTLTEKQYLELLNFIQPLIDITDQKGLQQLLGYTCYTLYKKSDIFEQPDSIPSMGHVSTRTIAEQKFSKLIRYNPVIMNPGKPVTLKVKGKVLPSVKQVCLIRYPQHEVIAEYPVVEGQFEFTESLPKEEMVIIRQSEGGLTHQVYVCADGKPLTIDLTKGTVKGSKLNEMLAENLPLMWKHIESHQLEELKRMATQNQNNILSAAIIMNIYCQMTLEELQPYLNDIYHYSQHPLLAPARQYAEGLEKRRLGNPCPDIELLDEENTLHQLRQYTDRRPTLIHFWNSSALNIQPIDRLQALHRQYPTLQIISIAIDQYPKEWRRLIEVNKMEWTNFLAPDGWASQAVSDFGITTLPETVLIGKDGTIVGVPRNMDELEEILKESDLPAIQQM